MSEIPLGENLDTLNWDDGLDRTSILVPLGDGGYELVQLGEVELNAVRSGDVAAA